MHRDDVEARDYGPVSNAFVDQLAPEPPFTVLPPRAYDPKLHPGLNL